MNQPRHVPMRRCSVCRASLPKSELLRFVQGPEGWLLDLRQRAGGRGTSLCRDCARAAVRRDDATALKRFRRVFQRDSDVVTQRLAELGAVLETTSAPPGASDPAPRHPASTPRARTHSNGGMHG